MKKKEKHSTIKSGLLRFARRILKKIATPFILFLHRNVRYKNLLESKRRKQLTIFETQELSIPLPYAPHHVCHGMNYYGFFYSFTNYAGIKKINPRYGIEHGLYLAAKGKKYSSEITFSDYREQMLWKSGSKAIKIGPYIHYAEPFLDNSVFTRLKQELGKVLLVFPTHSLDSFQATYDMQAFIDSIELHRTAYTTVMVCLHWKDFEWKRNLEYEKHGYKIVTAGHPYDTYFLSRLKCIINLSDMVIGNDIGTFLGYCIYLNKPVFLFSQPIYLNPNQSEKAFYKEINLRNREEWNELKQTKESFFSLFSKFEEKITDEQYNTISHLFGFEYVRDKETLRRLLR